MLLSLFIGLIISSISCSDKIEVGSNGKILTMWLDSSPSTLDPVHASATYANNIVTSIYDTLYEYKYLKTPYELKPNLAESMPEISDDLLTYTIKIKKGVSFIDDPCFKDGKGREVKIHDFIYAMKRHFDPKNKSRGDWLWQGKIVGLDDWKKNGADYSKDIAGLKALDDYTIQIKLVKPYPQIVYTLAMGFSALIPKEAVAKYGKEFSIKPVGSGPFKLASFNSQSAVIVKNSKYRNVTFNLAEEGYEESKHGFSGIKKLDGKQLPIVDKVIIRFIQEEASWWNSFTKGNEVSYCRVPVTMANKVMHTFNEPFQLKKNLAAKYHVRGELRAGFVYSVFNMQDPKIGYHKDPEQNKKNKALRCAVRKSFNWQERIRKFYYNIGKPYGGIIRPGIEGYSELADDSVQYDPEGAKKLLADNGWTVENLPVFEWHGGSQTRYKQFFEQFRAWLIEIGYPKKKIKYVSYPNYGAQSKASHEKKCMYFGQGWGLDYPDSENLMQLFYGPNESPGSNGANYKNAEYDKLYEQAAKMLPSKERTALYKRMNEIVIDDCVTIASYSRTRLHVWHKDVLMYPTESILGNYYKYIDIEKK